MLKRAIIVGASSGIGAALVRRLARGGYQVVAVARREQALRTLCDEVNRGGEPRAWPLTNDVTDAEASAKAFDAAVERLGGLDLVVYCAGVMPDVADDGFDPAVDRQIVETNVVGAMTWLDLAAARFQVQKGGTIVGIGSVAGDRGRRGNPAYCASKAALHTFLESLRNRLAREGVQVITVKPGPVRTPMTAGKEKLPLVIEADDAAEQIFRAIARRAHTVYVPRAWGVIMPIIRAIPSLVFRRMNL